MSGNYRPCLAEFVATFTLVFIGAGAVIIDAHTQGALGLPGIALAHGLAIAIGVNVTGHISGGHINPAVTAAMWVTGRISLNRAVAYIGSQLLGAIAGALLLAATFPRQAAMRVSFGTPTLAPGVSIPAGIVLEAVLTFLLLLAIFGSAVDPRGPKSVAGFVIGLTITMDILAGGPLTGAAMNPARAFGPALVSGLWTGHLIFWVGPLLGGIGAALVYDRCLLAKA